VAGIGAIIKAGFAESKDASAGNAQLAAGIKSTGDAAGVSVKGLNALASSIQGYSGQTDDSTTPDRGAAADVPEDQECRRRQDIR